MRALLLAAVLLATALPAAASPVVVDVRIDGGSFAGVCEDLALPAGATARDAVEECAARLGYATSYLSFGGDCFLDAVNGKANRAIDPSGLWLLGENWMFRVDGVLAEAGLCGTPAAAGAALSVDYELVAAWLVAVPTPATAVWIAAHLP